MWVFECVCVICVKSPFLHSLDVPMKMFANSLTILNQQTWGMIDCVHCFQTQFTESCLVVWFQVDKRRVCYFFLYKRKSGYPDQVLVDGEWNRPHVYLSVVVGARQGTHQHTLVHDYFRCMRREVHNRVPKHVIRCTKKHLPRFLIFETLKSFLKRWFFIKCFIKAILMLEK